MATVPCPGCGLPRADDLLTTTPCPLCGHSGREKPVSVESEPVHDRPWVIAEPQRAISPTLMPPGKANGRFLSGTLFGLVIGAGLALSWPIIRGGIPTPSPTPETTDATGATTISVANIEVAPLPREVSTAFRIPLQPVEPPDATAEAVVPPVEAIAVGPAPEPAPPNPFRPAVPAAMRVDNPDGESRPIVRPGSRLILRGRVKTLRISGLEAGAVLDCSELKASEIIVVGKIDGGSSLLLHAPGGTVAFRAKVDGRSKVEVRAPGGTVAFETPTELGREGSKIDGGAVVDVIAKVATFRGIINGAGTKVRVTLTEGGSLAFTEIDGPARLEYAKADPDDAEPKIARGTVRGPSVVAEVE